MSNSKKDNEADLRTSAPAVPDHPAENINAEAEPERDHHYKIKKMKFHAANESAAALLETAIKLDNAVVRKTNKMLALGKGKSKHKDKKEHGGKPDKEVIYSESTARTQYEIMHVYIGWALNSGKLWTGMKLPDLIPFVQEFLDEKGESCVPNTIHTYVSMICKALGLNMEEYDYPRRRRADVIGHRNGLADFCRTSTKYPDLVSFCLATGLRKYKECGRVKGSDLQTEEDGFSISVKGKGGLLRNAPVVGDGDEVELVVRLCREAGNKRVFPRLPANLDIHVFRAIYASRMYLLLARDVSKLPKEERYECRFDYKGIVLDVRAMEVVSRALGHHRIGIVAMSYLWPIEEYLFGREQAESRVRATVSAT